MSASPRKRLIYAARLEKEGNSEETCTLLSEDIGFWLKPTVGAGLVKYQATNNHQLTLPPATPIELQTAPVKSFAWTYGHPNPGNF